MTAMHTLNAKSVLITGFPSLLAQSLAQYGLTSDKKRRIYLFCEQGNKEAVTAFKSALTRSQQRRLKVLEGRADAVELGLTGRQIRDLSLNVDLIFHVGNPHASGRKVHRKLSNLRHLIRVAMVCDKLERFCLVSNTSVNRHPTRVIYEEELSKPSSDGTPSDILARIEMVVRELMPQLPCTIFRPSTIIGDTKLGNPYDVNQGLGGVLANLISAPSQIPVLIPQAREMPFNVVPIDFVVKAMWLIAMNPASQSRTFHLTDPNPMRMEDAFALFSDLTNRQRPLFYGRVFAQVIRVARRSVFRRLIPRQLIEKARGVIASSYDCSGTLELLQDSGLQCPPFESYADNLATLLALVEREGLSGQLSL